MVYTANSKSLGGSDENNLLGPFHVKSAHEFEMGINNYLEQKGLEYPYIDSDAIFGVKESLLT